MKKAKRSPKKIDFFNTASLMLNVIECQTKNLAFSYKTWHEKCIILAQSLDSVEKAIKNEISTKPAELNQEFSESNAMVLKLTKEIESAQKQCHKSQHAFKTKLSDPFIATGSTPTQPNHVETQASIDKIQGSLNADKKLLNEISEKYQTLTLRFVALESAVRKFCLTDHMAAMVKMNEKFITCAEALCQETVALGTGTHPRQFSPTEIKNTFLHLFNAHGKARQLLEQIQKNLGPIPDQTLTASTPAAAASS